MKLSSVEILDAIKEELKGRIARPKFDLLISPLFAVSEDEDGITLGVENAVLRGWVAEQYGKEISSIVERLAGRRVEVTFTVVPGRAAAAEQAAGPQCPKAVKPRLRPLLNPLFTFDNFVVGPANAFAYSAARGVAEKPGIVYNPLFIYSGSGLGKTHLLQSIAHHLFAANESADIVYITAEKFMNEFIFKVRSGRMHEFHAKFRGCDGLLIDDIHILAGKTETQGEFFNTFNYLHETSKVIVITCDKPPKELRQMDERLVSRFSSGLVADIEPPALETRIAILQKKAARENIYIPDEVCTFIAENITSNIRVLEGALIKLLAYSGYAAQPVTLDLAKRVLKDLLPESVSVQPISIDAIIDVTCDYLKVSRATLLSANRTKKVAFARQVAMYLARELTNLSLVQVGAELGDRDHSTVIYSYAKIERELVEDPYVQATVQNILRLVKTG
jgi:chromosomal replication initiator protein